MCGMLLSACNDPPPAENVLFSTCNGNRSAERQQDTRIDPLGRRRSGELENTATEFSMICVQQVELVKPCKHARRLPHGGLADHAGFNPRDVCPGGGHFPRVVTLDRRGQWLSECAVSSHNDLLQPRRYPLLGYWPAKLGLPVTEKKLRSTWLTAETLCGREIRIQAGRHTKFSKIRVRIVWNSR